jgi:hypothetical protein
MAHQQKVQETDFPRMCTMPLENKSLLAVFVVQKIARIKKKAARTTVIARKTLVQLEKLSFSKNRLKLGIQTTPEKILIF